MVSSRAFNGFHVKKQLEMILSLQEKQICAGVSHLKFDFKRKVEGSVENKEGIQLEMNEKFLCDMAHIFL